MEGLFALLHQQLTICKEVCGYFEINILYGLLCQLYAALLHGTSALGAGRNDLNCGQQCQDIHAFCKFGGRNFCRGGIHGCSTLTEQCSCGILCFGCFCFAMYDFCQLKGKDFLCMIDFRALQCAPDGEPHP